MHPPVAPPADVIGRDAELEAVSHGVAADRLPAFVVLDGEAGIGKTTVWAVAAALAAAEGTRVLSACPVEAEARLAYAVVADLLGGVLEVALPRLPAPQRRALEVALLLDEAGAAAPEERTVAAGFLSCLRVLTDGGPVLVAVDDVQWCDAASAGVLAFALRRLSAEPVGLLAARRVAAAAPLPLGLDRARPGTNVQRLEVGPLSLGALHQVLRRRLEISLARPVLRRVHQASGGNPFFALEIARALRGTTDIAPGEPLPVPTDLRDLVRDRLGALPRSTREVLPVIAALAEPSVELLERVSGAGAHAAIDAGVAAGVLDRHRQRLRFTHPLLAASAYASVAEHERADMHRRLAEAVDDPEQRAHHLAASAADPDITISAEIEAAARGALRRGALPAAAELFAAARRLLPAEHAGDDRRLAIDEARCCIEAGDNPRGRELLRRQLELVPAGAARAEVLQHLGRAYLWGFDWRRAVGYLEAAIAEPGAALSVRLAAQFDLMQAAALICDDVAALNAHARRTAELAEQAADEHLLATGLAVQARAELQLGRPFPSELAARAMALEPRLADASPMERPSDYLAVVNGWLDRVPDALAVLERIHHEALERGEETAIAWTVGRMSQLRCLTGDWELAREQARASYEFSEQAGQPANQATLGATLALVDAHRGAEAEARAWAAEAIELADVSGALSARRVAMAALGLLELSLGRPQAARLVLDPLVEDVRAAGFAEPGAMRFMTDAVEARLAGGDAGAAKALLQWYEGHARRTGRCSALAASLRCRGMLAASAGDPEAAIDSLHAALAFHAEVSIPLEQARTTLALGAAQRRAKRKREARATLEDAREQLERLGACSWRDRAEAEIASIGGRTAAGEELTATEVRVAELVAGGHTNREVAAQLFLSTKTVEFHLRNVFRKLGIHSRTQVRPALDDQG